MSKIKLFENVKKKLLSRNHPLIGFDSTIKYTYFTGIAIIADSANEDKTKKQKACSKISTLLDELSGSLDLSNELYLKALEIGENPDEGIVNDIVELLDQKIIRFLFLLDSHAMLKNAGKENNEEANQILNSLMQMFMFTESDHKLFEELKATFLKKRFDEFSSVVNKITDDEAMKQNIFSYYFPENNKKFLEDKQDNKNDSKFNESLCNEDNPSKNKKNNIGKSSLTLNDKFALIIKNQSLLESFINQSPCVNIPSPTMGGFVFWQIVCEYSGWKLQSNHFSGHVRLLDSQNIRRAWGSELDMINLINQIYENSLN